MNTKKNTAILLRLNHDLKDRLALSANTLGISSAELIRYLIIKFLKLDKE
jgi:predicted DNA-binding protein